jgi:4-amino-4-deoxy-L-arabinose transferase-like glycosyltransferase
MVAPRTRLLVVAILLAATGLRALALAGLHGSIYGDLPTPDEGTYLTWAQNILASRPFPAWDLSPLPAYLYAAIQAVAGTDILWIRIVNTAFGVATCGVLFTLGRELAGRSAGLVAALAAALYGPFILFSVAVLKESLGLLLFAGLVTLFVQELRGHRAWRVLLVGIVGGLLVNVRQNAGIALVVMAPVLLWRVHRTQAAGAPRLRTVVSGLLLAGGFLVGAGPFALLGHRDTGRWSFDPLAGFNLYLGNNLSSDAPYYRPVSFVVASATDQGVQFQVEASRRAGHRLSPGEASRFWMGEVLREAVRRPGVFILRLAEKALVVFHRHEESDHYPLEMLGQAAPFFRFPLLEFWLLMPLGMAGLLVSSRDDGRAAALLAVVVLYAATLVAFYSNMRIRAPLMVILIPFVPAGARRLIAPGRAGWVARAVALGFGLLELLPVPGTADLSAAYNMHGMALARARRLDEARELLQRSWDARGGYSDFAAIDSAFLAGLQGDVPGVRGWLGRIADGSYAASFKYDLLGDLERHEGRLQDAADAYRRSLAVNFGQRGAREKLVQILRQVDPAAAGREEETARWIAGFYEPSQATSDMTPQATPSP